MTQRRTGDAQGSPGVHFRQASAQNERGHGRRSAIDNLCRRARLGALPPRCNTCAVSELIFVAHLFRGCFVLKSLTPAVGFSSAWRVHFRSRYLGSRNRPPARAENVLASGAANADSCRLSVRCPALGDDILEVVTPCLHAASAAT